jgi:hypothetical protein
MAAARPAIQTKALRTLETKRAANIGFAALFFTGGREQTKQRKQKLGGIQ